MREREREVKTMRVDHMGGQLWVAGGSVPWWVSALFTACRGTTCINMHVQLFLPYSTQITRNTKFSTGKINS